MQADPIPAFRDNYIWALRVAGRAPVAVVDPGDDGPVEDYLARTGRPLAAILLTHHHADHVGGAQALSRRHRCPVFGPDGPAGQLCDRRVGDGERVLVPGIEVAFGVLGVPGHTMDHIAYHGQGALFCGDTLFAGGCGRLFEGQPEDLWGSLRRLAALPGPTRVYCGHEYTVANLRFAAAAEPGSMAVTRRLAQVERLRAQRRPTLPSRMALERATNPFLRDHVPRVQHAVAEHLGAPATQALAEAPWSHFVALRSWKDGFRPG